MLRWEDPLEVTPLRELLYPCKIKKKTCIREQLAAKDKKPQTKVKGGVPTVSNLQREISVNTYNGGSK